MKLSFLSRVSFEGLYEGRYAPEIEDEPRAASVLKKTHPRAKGFLAPKRAQEGVSLGAELFSLGAEDQDQEPVVGAMFAEAIGVSRGEKKRQGYAEKTPDVNFLETFLGQAYGDLGIEITRIEALPMTRKEVRRVYFAMGDELHQVWVYKAKDPKETAQELTICQVAHERKISTAKPIGYDWTPGGEYPYDIAVLGGIVDHAGDPYYQMLQNLELTPHKMFETAKGIARLLADFHVKLTSAQSELGEKGIEIKRTSPRKEILERMVAALPIQSRDAEPLIKACEDLYDKQQGTPLVSHGDIHPGNIVTILTDPRHTTASLSKFGLIDYGSVCLDSPAGDLSDFWIHHQRKAIGICGNYEFSYDDFEHAYNDQFGRIVERESLTATPGNKRNAMIQQVLWHVYEMFDPVRKDPEDIMAKASYHSLAFSEAGKALESQGLLEEFQDVRAGLDNVLGRSEVRQVLN